MRIKTVLPVFLLLFTVFGLPRYSKAQEIIWKAGFNGFFDNREYYNDFTIPQTIFGTRTHLSAGLVIYENYSFHAGLDMLYEFGSSFDIEDTRPLFYFRYQKEPFDFLMGSFHRRGLLDMPDVLQTDTIGYYRPTIEGLFVEFRKNRGFQNLWLDWTSRQTKNDREIFHIGGTGMFRYSAFFYRHDILFTHYALSKEPSPDEHIRDNGGFYVRIGAFHPNSKIFDSLSFSTGYTFSYDRLRGIYGFEYRNGSISEFYMQYRGLGIRSTLYFGEGQVQLLGDALYSAGFYNRNDIFYKVFRKDLIEGRIEFSLHVIENVLDVSQSLSIYISLSGKRKLKPED
ncbi:MAG: hypothetical protein PVF73_12925 [Bacteroidales bacterium]|jgi:hypothetical protein